MKVRLVRALVVSLCGVVVASCGQKAAEGDRAASSGGTVAGGAAGSGGTAAGAAAGQGGSGAGTVGGGSSSGSGGSGPVITSAPPAWERPADCGGIGDRCQGLIGCGSLSSCQLDGNVCIPEPPEGSVLLPSRSPERPYCAAYTCMTFDEASCFCTGEAGKTVANCSSPGALAGLCTGLDGSCADRACCDGLTCVNLGSSRICKQPCSDASDCESGCCTDRYDTGDLVCAELEACMNPCKKRGEACTPGTSTSATDCCRGACVESENPAFAGCRPTCTKNEHCDTGCCVPFASGKSGFCASAEYCSCLAEGTSCGQNLPNCCDGTLCAGTSVDTLTCRRRCTTDADCPGTKCLPFADGSARVCDTACSSLGEPCGSSGGLNCCAGMTCAGSEENGYTCRRSCSGPSDCPSGNCQLFPERGGICVE